MFRFRKIIFPESDHQVNWDKELDEEAERQRRRKKDGTKSSSSQNSLPPVKKPEVVPQIPKPRSTVSPKPSRGTNSATLDLLGLGNYRKNQTALIFYKKILQFHFVFIQMLP